MNLIKPHQFSHKERNSVDAAMRLAMAGNLLQRHGTDQVQNARLIVVSSFEEQSSPELASRVNGLFREYEVENLSGDNLDKFLARVEREAH